MAHLLNLFAVTFRSAAKVPGVLVAATMLGLNLSRSGFTSLFTFMFYLSLFYLFLLLLLFTRLYFKLFYF